MALMVLLHFTVYYLLLAFVVFYTFKKKNRNNNNNNKKMNRSNAQGCILHAHKYSRRSIETKQTFRFAELSILFKGFSITHMSHGSSTNA